MVTTILDILVKGIELIKEYKMWGVVLLLISLVICFLRILLDEDKSDFWRGRIYKFIYKLTRKREAEKEYIANDITGCLNLARRQMPFAKDLVPKKLEVEWVDNTKGESYVPKEGELVVKLDSAEAQEKNIVYLAQALVRETALIGVRYILSEPLEGTIDLNLVKNLLKEIKNSKILDWYMEYEYTPKINQEGVLKEWNSKIVEIDERGLFTRLLLVELDDYGKRIVGRPKTSEMESEIEGLVEFLYEIATKAYGENTPLDYISKNIKIGVLIVGETSKVLFSGIEPYIRAFVYKLNQRIEAIYVLSFSKEFLKEQDETSAKAFEEIRTFLHQKIEQDFKVQKDFELTYFCTDVAGRKRKAKCIRYIPIYD